MVGEDLLLLDHEKVKDLLREGAMKVVAPTRPRTPEPAPSSTRMEERARQVLGENFLGADAFRIMEGKLQTLGKNVRFEVSNASGLTDFLIDGVAEDERQGKGRLIVLRPTAMVVEGQQMPVNLCTLRDLFKREEVDPEDSNATLITYDNNPFGEGAIFYVQHWYDEQDFAKEPMKPGYGVPTREILPDSMSKKWDEQQALLTPDEIRREAVEVAWDSILYYAVTGKKLLENRWDWTNTASDAHRVRVGDFDSDGLVVGHWYPGAPDPSIGVCSSRVVS